MRMIHIARTHATLVVLGLGSAMVVAAGCDGGPQDEPSRRAAYELVTVGADNQVKRQMLDAEGNEIAGDFAPQECRPDIPTFFDSCDWPKGFRRYPGTCTIYQAYSVACKKPGGKGGKTELESGPCDGDVSNCNGRIICAAQGCR